MNTIKHLINAMKSGSILFFIAFLILPFFNQAQISTVPGYNYYDINKDAFTLDASCLNADPEVEEEVNYWFTSLQLAESIQTMFLDTDPTPQDITVGGYRISKRDYLINEVGSEIYSWVLIRPDDQIKRPTVVITHGGATGDGGPAIVLNLGVVDYVQRGYAVIFYQSSPSQNGDRLQATIDAGFIESCQRIWSPDDDIICLQQAIYFRTQLSKAALQYTFAQAEQFSIDEDNIFTAAFSGGSISTLYALLSDESDFEDPLFSDMGMLNKLSKYPDQTIDIKKSINIGGGMLGNGTQDFRINEEFFNELQSETEFLFMHGQEDIAVLPDKGPLAWSNPGGVLAESEILCALELDRIFKENNLKSKAIINCSGGHDLLTMPCDYNDDYLGNNPQFIVQPSECLNWANTNNFKNYNYNNLCDPNNSRDDSEELFYILMQMHDNAKIGAYYMHQAFSESGPERISDDFVSGLFEDQELSTVGSKEVFQNPNAIANGHLAVTDKCYNQECNALFFNRDGIGEDPLLGDYLNLPGTGHNIFNNDFTIEFIFRQINQEGIGTLFSRRDNLGLGFELIINGEGKLQFIKNIDGQASIVGNKVIDDECHHVALMREGDKFTIFLDQVEDIVFKEFPVSFPGNPPIRIGNRRGLSLDGKRGFNGIISSIRISETALNPNDFSSVNPGTEGALSYWVLGKSYEQEIQDQSGTYKMTLGKNNSSILNDPKAVFQDELCVCEPPSVIISTKDLIDIRQSDLVLSPNPSNGIIHIVANEKLGKLMGVEIYQMDAKLISREEGPLFNQISIKRSGIYFVKCYFEAATLTEKIIVVE